MADELKIPIIISATGVQPGVDTTVAGLKKIVVSEAEVAEAADKLGVSTDLARSALEQLAAEKNAAQIRTIKAALQETTSASEEVGSAGEESAEKLVEGSEKFDSSVLTNRRSVSHLLRGMLEMKEGGIAALGGLASEGFVATEAFEGMLGPLAPILMAITLITALAVPMVEKFTEHNDKLEEGKEKEDDFGAAAKNAAEIAKTTIEAATDSLREYLDIQTQIIAGERERAGYEQQRLKDIESQHSAATKLALAELDLAKQRELSQAKTDTQRDAIETRYKARENAVKGASTDDKYKSDQAAIEAQAKANQEQLQTLYADNVENSEKLKALQDAASSAASKVEAHPDATGSYEPAIKDQQRKADEAEKSYRDSQKGGDSAQIGVKQRESIEENSKLADLQEAQTAHEELIKQGADLKKALEKSEDEVRKLLDQNDHLSREQDTLAVNYKATKTEEQAKGIADTTGGNEKLTRDQKREKDEKQRQQDQSDRRQIDQISGAIQASGNKESIAKLRQIVEKDKGDLTKELADLVNAHISTQTQINTQLKQSIIELRETQKRHSKSLSNPGGNG